MKTSPIEAFPRSTLVLALAAAGVILSGCGGGGSGGSSNVRDNDDDEVVVLGQLEHYGLVENGERIEQQGADATIVLLDGPVNADHAEFSGTTIHAESQRYDPDDNPGDDVQFDVNHGTAVASVALGQNIGAAPEATMLSYTITINGSTISDALNDASQVLQDAQAAGPSPLDRPVVNASLNSTHNAATWGDFQEDTGALIVAAAGNSGAPEPGAPGRYADYQELNGSLIVVGALNARGDDIANFSNRPGSVQDYYLLAPGQMLTDMREGFNDGVAEGESNDGYRVVSGTSVAAPFVSGVAALVWSKPNAQHLEAHEVVEILLETADTDALADYDRDRHGRGIVDPVAALEPVGAQAMSFDAVNDSGSREFEATGMTTGAAFGDSFASAAGLDSVAVFDQFGRDFHYDLTGAVQRPRHSSLDRAMMRPHGYRATESVETEGFAYTASYMNGGLESFQSQMNIGNVRLGVASRDSMELTPNDGPLDLVGAHRLLSAHSADAYLDDWFGAQGGHLGYDMGAMELSVSHMVNRGSTDRFGIEHDDPQGNAARTLVRAGFAPLDNLNVGVTAGMVRDDERLFGTQGSGGFQMDGDNATQTIGVDMVYAMNDRVDLFARYEHGRTNTIRNSNSLVSQIDGLQTSSGSAGFVASAADHVRFGGVVAQPLRVEGGTADLTIPVGRDLSGNVMLAEESVDLSPSGRQTDYELFLDFDGQGNHSTRFNVMYSTEPGHVASNPSEWGAMVSHQRQF